MLKLSTGGGRPHKTRRTGRLSGAVFGRRPLEPRGSHLYGAFRRGHGFGRGSGNINPIFFQGETDMASKLVPPHGGKGLVCCLLEGAALAA